MTTIRETFHYGNEHRERVVDLEAFTLESVADIIRAQATPSVGAEHVNRAARDILTTGRGELGWTTWVVEAPLFEERDGGAYYLGPLDPVKAYLRECYDLREQTLEGGAVRVAEYGSPGSNSDDPQTWGVSASGDWEEAWRYFVGADFGATVEEEGEGELRAILTMRRLEGGDVESVVTSSDLDTSLRDARPDLARLLVELAERHESDPTRPACDADTTLRDWVDSGHYTLKA